MGCGARDYTSASTNKPLPRKCPRVCRRARQWYLDYASGLLTYQAAGAKTEHPRIYRPFLGSADRRRRGPGESGAKPPLRGIAFEHSRWDLPEFGYLGIQAGHYANPYRGADLQFTAILFLYAEDCTVNRCACAIPARAASHSARARAATAWSDALADIGGNGLW